jgi:Acetyltransferase (GNAT) domain
MPSQKRLSAVASTTGTHSVSRGVGAGERFSDTCFMLPLTARKAFTAVNDAMAECEEFAGFLPLQQSEPYAVAVAANGARVRRIDLDVGQALVVERGRMRLISRGPVWAGACSASDQRRALRQLARWPGITFATPETAIAGFGVLPLITPMHHAIWQLAPDLRSMVSGKWRNRLIASEKAGIQPKTGDAATLLWLQEAEAIQRRARGYRSLPHSFTQALPATALRLWHWRRGAEIAAAMAFVVHGSTATYHLGCGSEAARAAGAQGVMLMAAAEALWTEGVRWLDLGSVDTDRAPGLARFKLGTGARLKPLGPTVLVLP